MEDLFRFLEWPVLISIVRKKRRRNLIRRMKRSKKNKRKMTQKILKYYRLNARIV
jgi:predicted protein tyrosine phosphatase